MDLTWDCFVNGKHRLHCILLETYQEKLGQRAIYFWMLMLKKIFDAWFTKRHPRLQSWHHQWVFSFQNFCNFLASYFCNFSHIVWCIIYGVCYWHFPSSGLGNNCISHFTINFSNCLQVKTKLEQLAGSFPISSSTGFRSSFGGENFVCVYF